MTRRRPTWTSTLLDLPLSLKKEPIVTAAGDKSLMQLLIISSIICGTSIRPPPPLPSRRAFVIGGLAGFAGCSAAPRPAFATLSLELRDAEAALGAARDTDSITASLEKLRDIVDEYDGLQGPALTEELVNVMRTKRSSLQGTTVWNGIPEEAYNSLMRKVDPWRVTELAPKFQYSIYASAPAYLALIAVQQLAPKIFPVAYAGAAALVLGPLVAQIIIG